MTDDRAQPGDQTFAHRLLQGIASQVRKAQEPQQSETPLEVPTEHDFSPPDDDPKPGPTLVGVKGPSGYGTTTQVRQQRQRIAALPPEPAPTFFRHDDVERSPEPRPLYRLAGELSTNRTSLPERAQVAREKMDPEQRQAFDDAYQKIQDRRAQSLEQQLQNKTNRLEQIEHSVRIGGPKL